MENVTQAVARDVLGAALVRLVEGGHRVVGHVHDEVIVESSPESSPESSLAAIRRVMVTPTEWSDGLPLAVAVDQVDQQTDDDQRRGQQHSRP